MKLLYLSNSKWYSSLVEGTLADNCLKNSFQFNVVTPNAFGTVFVELLSDIVKTPLEQRSNITVVVDTDDEESICSLIQNLKRMSSLIKYFRIIAISTLLTWAGKSYDLQIISPDTECLNRVPHTSASTAYLTENELFSFAKKNKAKVTILSLGLVYGGGGYDFQDFFRNIWTSEPSYTLHSTHESNRVPMIHIDDFIAHLCRLVETYTPEDDTIQPCVDNGTESIQTVLNALNAKINPTLVIDAGSNDISSASASAPTSEQVTTNPTPRSSKSRPQSVQNSTHVSAAPSPRPNAVTDAAEASAVAVTETQVVEAPTARPYIVNATQEQLIMTQLESNDNRNSLWDCNLSFAAPNAPPCLLSNFDSVWLEYLQSNNLKPLSIVLAGGPRVGKTDAARALATELSIEYVDITSAAKFAFNMPSTTIRNLSTDTYNTSAMLTVRSELESILEAKTNEASAGNKKKDKNAPVEPIKFDDTHITDAVALALPVNLARKCIAMQLNFDTKCVRYGYVLDIWGLGNDILNGYTSLCDLYSCILNVSHIHSDGGASSEPAADTPTTTAMEGSEQTLAQENSNANSNEAKYAEFCKSLVRGKVELFVELQTPDATIIERLLASQGATAKAKDSQAAAKALEAILATYRANIVPLPTICVPAEGVMDSHKGVVEIEVSCRVAKDDADAETETMDSRNANLGAADSDGTQGALGTAGGNATVAINPTNSVCNTTEQSSGSLEVLRIACAELSAEQIVAVIVTKMFDKHNGVIGWLPSRGVAGLPVAVATTTDIVGAGTDAVSGTMSPRGQILAVGGDTPPPAAAVVTAEEKTASGTDTAISANEKPRPVIQQVSTSVTSEEIGGNSAFSVQYNKLSDVDKASLKAKSEKAQQFLSATVLPHIAAAMIQIRRNRPEDPIAYIAEYLRQQSEAVVAEEREAAKEVFCTLLANGKA